MEGAARRCSPSRWFRPLPATADRWSAWRLPLLSLPWAFTPDSSRYLLPNGLVLFRDPLGAAPMAARVAGTNVSMCHGFALWITCVKTVAIMEMRATHHGRLQGGAPTEVARY